MPPKSVRICKLIEIVTNVLVVMTFVVAYFGDIDKWWPGIIILLIGTNMYASGYIRGFYRGTQRPSKLKGP